VGIEGFAESVAQEVAPFGIGVTIVEPGGARTEFRYGSAQVAELNPAYDGNPAHAFLAMLDPANGPAVGDPARMAARIIDSVDTEPAPLRLVLGSQALDSTLATLQKRIALASRPSARWLPPPTSRPESDTHGHQRRSPQEPRRAVPWPRLDLDGHRPRADRVLRQLRLRRGPAPRRAGHPDPAHGAARPR
jgi:hypothetical protein